MWTGLSRAPWADSGSFGASRSPSPPRSGARRRALRRARSRRCSRTWMCTACDVTSQAQPVAVRRSGPSASPARRPIGPLGALGPRAPGLQPEGWVVIRRVLAAALSAAHRPIAASLGAPIARVAATVRLLVALARRRDALYLYVDLSDRGLRRGRASRARGGAARASLRSTYRERQNTAIELMKDKVASNRRTPYGRRQHWGPEGRRRESFDSAFARTV